MGMKELEGRHCQDRYVVPYFVTQRGGGRGQWSRVLQWCVMKGHYGEKSANSHWLACFIYFVEKEAENSEVDENVPTAEEATEATEGNAGSAEDTVDTSQPGVYTEHVFTDPLGVQIPEDLSPVYQSRYTDGLAAEEARYVLT